MIKSYKEYFSKPLVKAIPTKSCEHCDPQEEMEGPTSVYKDFLSRRKIILNGVIDEKSFENVAMQILKFNEIDDEQENYVGYNRLNNPIQLIVSSPGGYISYGLAIISQITQSNTPVVGIAANDISSMSTLVIASCHARFISKYSRVMVHSLSSGTMGKYQDIIDESAECGILQKTLDSILTSKTLITQKKLDELHLRKQDWYLDSSQAVALSIVDDIIPDGLRMTSPRKRKK